jgi:hypothetical protein
VVDVPVRGRVGFATESYDVSALYTTLASLSTHLKANKTG